MLIEGKEIRLGDGTPIGGGKNLFLIAGPCVIESESHALFLAREIKKVCQEIALPFIF